MVGGIDKQIYLPYQLAQNLGFYKKYGVNVELSTEQAGGVVPALPEDYRTKGRTVAEEQIALAGYRMAERVNGGLGSAQKSSGK